MDARDWLLPEWELRDVDPFLAQIIQADEAIDYADETASRRVVEWRLSFELETLYRWWALR
jgi:hypothetical protein